MIFKINSRHEAAYASPASKIRERPEPLPKFCSIKREVKNYQNKKSRYIFEKSREFGMNN